MPFPPQTSVTLISLHGSSKARRGRTRTSSNGQEAADGSWPKPKHRRRPSTTLPKVLPDLHPQKFDNEEKSRQSLLSLSARSAHLSGLRGMV